MLIINGVYVDITTGEILGYKVGGYSIYSVAVTFDKAKELGVQDIDVAQYMDFEKIECLKGRGSTYALIENQEFYISELEDTPYEKLDGKVALYGYVFKDSSICEFDNKLAIERLILAEKSGIESDEGL